MSLGSMSQMAVSPYHILGSRLLLLGFHLCFPDCSGLHTSATCKISVEQIVQNIEVSGTCIYYVGQSD